MGVFPNSNDDSNNYFNTVVPYLNSNSARLQISAANLTAVNDYYDKAGVVQNDLGWKQLWTLYSNEDTVTTSVRDLIKTRKVQLRTALRTVYKNIPDSLLTVNDRNTLNLHEPDFDHTPIPPVTFPPVLSFENIENNIHTLRIQNPQTPDSNAMPSSQSCEVWNFVGAANLPDNSLVFQLLKDSGKHLLKANYVPTQKGQTAYYRARYKSPTGDYGPWSDVVSEIIL
jgi:hypothetical protein